MKKKKEKRVFCEASSAQPRGFHTHKWLLKHEPTTEVSALLTAQVCGLGWKPCSREGSAC